MTLPRSMRRPTVRVAAMWLATMLLAVLVGGWMSPYVPAYIDFGADWGTPPSLQGSHWFGTDSLGRDLFVRTLSGGRVSLAVGLVSTLVAVMVGLAYGAVAGFKGGAVDRIMMRAVDVLYALPFMFLVILLSVLFGRSLLLLFAAIGAVNWLDTARVVRGRAMSLRNSGFVDAARVAGASDLTIVWRHIVPNLLGLVAVYAVLILPQVIMIESFISFLGLGPQASVASWGALIDEGAREMEVTPWSLIFPSLFLVGTLISLNVIGDALRAALDAERDS